MKEPVALTTGAICDIETCRGGKQKVRTEISGSFLVYCRGEQTVFQDKYNANK